MLLKLLLRNAFRHKLRAGLTICGICVAILAFGLLRTIVSAWYAGVDASSSTRLVTRNAISLIFPLPLSYKDKIRSVEGVKIVSLGNWFGGIYIEEKNFFANFAVDSNTYLDLYPEFVIPPDQKLSFIEEPDIIRKILVHLDLWETRNHDPPTEKYTQIPELTYDDFYSQLPFADAWIQ